MTPVLEQAINLMVIAVPTLFAVTLLFIGATTLLRKLLSRKPH